jgi:murein DD-endopeptidase MepM/ murein hydrolase activator NlpD
VHAVADGTVIYAGWKGANGKLVSLRHANGFVTHYAHLSQITKKLRPGVRVKQKDQIGRVGTTGRSTGPHLHFGMTQHGKVINPLTVDFARAEPLKGAERQAFKEKAESLKAQL